MGPDSNDTPISPTPTRLPTRLPTCWWHWWPMLLAPLCFPYVYWAMSIDRLDPLAGRGTHEPVALVLMGTTVVLMGLRAGVTRQPFYLLLTLASIAFLFREIHWDWTTSAVYIAIGLLGVWAFFWRDPLFAWLDANPRVRVVFFSTVFAYALAVIVQRRALRGVLPHERELHIEFEEVMENVAHLLLLMTALIGPWRRSSRASE